MTSKPPTALEARVERAASAALEAQRFVSPIDVLAGIGWLQPVHIDEWRHGRLPTLEAALSVSPPKIDHALRVFRAWAERAQLVPSEAAYVARHVSRATLRFTESGDPELERAYRTHWMSPALGDRERARIEAKASAVPELVAIESRRDWKCHRCAGTGPWLVMEPQGPACLRCLGFGDLAWLPSGDAAVTRRARASSERHLVVMRWQRSTKRYQRVGTLVEPGVLRSMGILSPSPDSPDDEPG